MNLISTLNEASALPIEDLQKVMQKDARVKQLFQPSLALEDIKNQAEFLATVKFFLLNNRNVIEFVDDRNYIKDMDKVGLKRLRELKPVDLKQRDIDQLQEFVRQLFREHAHVERVGLSGPVRKEVLNWVNSSGRYYDLTGYAKKELASVPGLKPDGPIVVYRGLLFNSNDLKERKSYDGTMSVGNGLKFLKSVRAGSRVVDLDWDRPSSWSTSREIAIRFAMNKAAHSNFEATMNWLNGMKDDAKIHGDLGFVISMLVQPEDVLIDVRKLATSAHMKHGDEGEVIVAAGKYTCRVNTKYTKTSGEVDPVESSRVTPELTNVIQAVRQFSRTWGAKGPWDDLISDDWSNVEVERELRSGNISGFGVLSRASTKEAALKAWADLSKFYNENIEKISPDQLETLVSNHDIGRVVGWINDLRKFMNGNARHGDFKTGENPKGESKIKKLSPEQHRETSYTPLADSFGTATKGGRFTEYRVGQAIGTLLKAFNDEEVRNVDKMKGANQQEHVDRVLSSFYKSFDLEQPPVREEAIRKMKSALMGAERNAAVISKVLNLRKELTTALRSDSDDSDS
jgi:hypothetical protein